MFNKFVLIARGQVLGSAVVLRGSGEGINPRNRCLRCKGNKVIQSKKMLEKGMLHGQKIVFKVKADEVPGLSYKQMITTHSRERKMTCLRSNISRSINRIDHEGMPFYHVGPPSHSFSCGFSRVGTIGMDAFDKTTAYNVTMEDEKSRQCQKDTEEAYGVQCRQR
ncbi:hypothetical protein L7F22_061135 [Adiantum nelumboides]|nr:hypothetical protein [Adiantum nelumboides]